MKLRRSVSVVSRIGGIALLLLITLIDPVSLSDFTVETKQQTKQAVASSTPKTVKQAKVKAVVPIAHAQELEPTQLIIPKIKVNSPIVAMGLTEEGKMAVPDNYTEVGWYKFGGHPGEKGSAVMGAHLDDGKNIPGVFKRLKYLNIGDDIYVATSENNILKYKVIDKKVYAHNAKETSEVFAQSDKARLNLITCHGTYMPKLDTYDQRIVIFAELVTS